MTLVRLAHSPDADDAFMFYGLFQGGVDRGALQFEEVREDIETLNRRALEGIYEVSAISLQLFPKISDRYRLLSTGACFGLNYGPVVVANKAIKARQALRALFGIPGKQTTAFLVLKLWEHQIAAPGKSGICYKEIPFDQILDQVAGGRLDAGLLIHEGQLSWSDRGLHKVVDLGEWWHKQTGLPLPLGGIAVRRDLEPGVQEEVHRVVQESIRHGLAHKEEALAYALPFARGLDSEKTLQFVERYVNDLTVEMGRQGTKALKVLYEWAVEHRVLEGGVDLDECLLKGRRKMEAAELQPSPEPSPPEQSPSEPPPPEESGGNPPPEEGGSLPD